MASDDEGPRLDRLEDYLRLDPCNCALLAEAFDAALRRGDATRAGRHLRDAQGFGAADAAWRLREAHWLLAVQRIDEARDALRRLAADADVPRSMQPALAQDLAYVALRQGDPALARATLAPHAAAVQPTEPLDEGLQVLWLRALHRRGDLDDGAAWSAARWRHGGLAAAAAGVASLIALDAGDFARCDAWSAFALARHPHQPEALIGRASVALAGRDAASARPLLEAALRLNRDDGRAWSSLGFCQLLERDLAGARASFDAALRRLPAHIGTWHGAGWTALLRRDLTAAQACFESALALDRNFAESHGGLAVSLAMRGRESSARASIDRAMRLDRANVSARYAQALLDGDARDAGALRRLAERLLAGVPAPMGGTVLDLLAGAPAAPAD